ncbi:MAG: hypothetical protein ACFFD2_04855 [Promethearchaeota archaeon]
MLNKKILIIILIAMITVGILVPVFLLTRRHLDTIPPTIEILSPTNTTYFSQTTQIIINFNCSDSDVDTIWYRLYNQTGGDWVDPTNITWTSSTPKTLGKGGVYTLYAWANDTHGLISSAAIVTFTMYHEIIYSGNQVFASTFTVDTYQKVIFQNGDFSFTSGDLIVNGILDIYNVTWTSALTMDADSAVSVINCTFNGQLQTYGNLVASFNNVTFLNWVILYGNSTISVTDAVFKSNLRTYDFTKLTITDSSLINFEFRENSEVNISYSTCSSWVELHDYSNVILKNFTMSSAGIECWRNTSLALINSTIAQRYDYIVFDSGNWLIDHNTISGSGIYAEPTITVINSAITSISKQIRTESTSNVLVNNSVYNQAELRSESNMTLYNTTISNFYVQASSNAIIINSTINYIRCYTNGTIYLEDVNSDTIEHQFAFFQGDISGYNETFMGAESWTFPKITMGSNVSYTNYYYRYVIDNQVDFTLINTSQVWSFVAYDTSNISIHFCNMPDVYMYIHLDANITLYYSWINSITGFNNANLTLFNSTCYRVYLHQSAFASIINESLVHYLYLYDAASYYLSPDSTIDNIY